MFGAYSPGPTGSATIALLQSQLFNVQEHRILYHFRLIKQFHETEAPREYLASYNLRPPTHAFSLQKLPYREFPDKLRLGTVTVQAPRLASMPEILRFHALELGPNLWLFLHAHAPKSTARPDTFVPSAGHPFPRARRA